MGKDSIDEEENTPARVSPLAFTPATIQPSDVTAEPGEDPHAQLVARGEEDGLAEDDVSGKQDEDAREDDDSGKTDEDKGQQGGGDSGGGGGVTFDETEHDFDDAELQGLSLPIFRRALKKGLQLASRVTKQVERDLRNFLPGGLHARVVELAFSKNGHPTPAA